MILPAGCQTSFCGEPLSKENINFWQIFFSILGTPHLFIFLAPNHFMWSACPSFYTNFWRFFLSCRVPDGQKKSWFYIERLKSVLRSRSREPYGMFWSEPEPYGTGNLSTIRLRLLHGLSMIWFLWSSIKLLIRTRHKWIRIVSAFLLYSA